MATSIGANVTEVLSLTNSTQGKMFGLGDLYEDGATGNIYVWCVAGGTITAAGYACIIDKAAGAFSATMLSTSTDAYGQAIGRAPGAMVATDYGWFQIFGYGTCRALTSCAANVRLNTTGTAGALDDDGTSTTFPLNGLILTTAVGGGGADTVAAQWNYPVLGVVL